MTEEFNNYLGLDPVQEFICIKYNLPFIHWQLLYKNIDYKVEKVNKRGM